MTKLTNLNKLMKKKQKKNSVLNFTTELIINKKKSLSYLQTPQIITNSLHLHIKKLSNYNSTLFNYHGEFPSKYKIAKKKKTLHS